MRETGYKCVNHTQDNFISLLDMIKKIRKQFK